MAGKDGPKKKKKNGPTFASLNAMPAKKIMVSAFWWIILYIVL